MQTHYPSDDFESSPTGKRFFIALGLAVVVAITLVVSMRDDPVQPTPRPSVNVPNAITQQSVETVEVAFAKPKAPRRAVVYARQPARVLGITPLFDSAARAQLQQSIQKSINVTLTKLRYDLKNSKID